MELKTKDTYRAECRHGVSEEALNTLMVLYQPLVGSDAVLIYLTLAAEAQNPHGQDSLQRLFTLTDIPVDTFERACAKLEEYMLMRTYVKEAETKNSYIYVLNQPQSAQDFTSNSFYMSRYLSAMGQSQTEISVTRAAGGSISLQGYRDITHSVKNMKTEDYDRSVSYVEVKPKYVFTADDATIHFDYERFLTKCSSLVFPVELRSQENMALIGKLATVYGLSVDRMLILVKECVRLSTMEFDGEKLKIKAARTKSDVEPGKDIYEISPVSFLQSKQNGAEVSFPDKKLIEHLATDMHFSNTVINIMLEHILDISANKLVPSFVDSIAGEWARDGVATKEQALLETKKQMPAGKYSRGHIKIDLPEYMKKMKEEGIPEGSKASDEQIQAALEMQRKMKERRNHGKG